MYKDLLGDIESDIDKDWSQLLVEKENVELKNQLSYVHSVLDEIVDINKKNRKDKSFLPLDNYISSFCTIRMNIGRQIGMTTWIINRVMEGDIVIVPNRSMIECSYANMLNKRDINVDVVTMDTVKRNTPFYASRDYNNIYVDVASYIGEQDITEMMYYIFPRDDMEQTFFLLG